MYYNKQIYKSICTEKSEGLASHKITQTLVNEKLVRSTKFLDEIT